MNREVLAMPIDVKILRGTSIVCLSFGRLIWYIKLIVSVLKSWIFILDILWRVLFLYRLIAFVFCFE